MRLKKTKLPPEIRKMELDLRKSDLEVRQIIKEHDSLTMSDDGAINGWYNSMPIETLRESLEFDLKQRKSKYCLKDLLRKFALRKEYIKKQREFEKKRSELIVAKVDFLLSAVKNIGLSKKEEANG